MGSFDFFGIFSRNAFDKTAWRLYYLFNVTRMFRLPRNPG